MLDTFYKAFLLALLLLSIQIGLEVLTIGLNIQYRRNYGALSWSIVQRGLFPVADEPASRTKGDLTWL